MLGGFHLECGGRSRRFQSLGDAAAAVRRACAPPNSVRDEIHVENRDRMVGFRSCLGSKPCPSGRTDFRARRTAVRASSGFRLPTTPCCQRETVPVCPSHVVVFVDPHSQQPHTLSRSSMSPSPFPPAAIESNSANAANPNSHLRRNLKQRVSNRRTCSTCSSSQRSCSVLVRRLTFSRRSRCSHTSIQPDVTPPLDVPLTLETPQLPVGRVDGPA